MSLKLVGMNTLMKGNKKRCVCVGWGGGKGGGKGFKMVMEGKFQKELNNINF